MKTLMSYYKDQGLNEELPEIIRTARVGECYKIKMKQTDKIPRKEVDIKNMSTEDLKSIQRQDPFLYHSIPGVRSAKMLMKDIDVSNLGASELCNSSVSYPSRRKRGVHSKVDQSQKVTRSTCISFECHPDLLLDDLSSDDIDLEDEEDPLDFLVAQFAKQ